MAACREEHQAVQDALERYGEGSPEHREAQEAFQDCLIHEGMIQAGRSSHAAAWDEKLWLLFLELQAAWERVFGKIRKPFPPPCGPRSIEVRREILEDRSTAMLFSKKLDEAFQRAKVELAEDETFACSICVVKKPEFVSDAMKLDPLGLSMIGGSRVNYVMEPAIMAPLLGVVEQDRIDYDVKGGK
jgi:hypothetical protein